MRDLLQKGLTELEISNYCPQAVDKLEKFAELLVEKNSVMNLTAITDPFDIATKHFLDCATLLKFVNISDKNVADIGCGPGFPSMPLKILYPETNMTMLDCLKKRITFIEETCGKLDISEGVFPIHARGEEFALENIENFDVVLSRAVTKLNMLSEICLPLVKIGGHMICMKSANCDDEIEDAKHAIELLGGGQPQIYDVKIPFTDIVHRIVMVEKIKETPTEYPRKWNKMVSIPL